MSGDGLRNWRGEIIHPKASGGDDVQGKDQQLSVTKVSSSLSGSGKTELSSPPSIKRHSAETKVIRKDEFGRDVVEVKRRKSKTERKEKKREKKQKHKRHKHRRDRNSDRSRSPSPQGRLQGTPPPEDPFRPQMKDAVAL
ncbi:hypothetical protein DVH05_001673 [Phytophthora capsici]|nr:hypothetical protein DVH05_001673 [Phytophthora capsici]